MIIHAKNYRFFLLVPLTLLILAGCGGSFNHYVKPDADLQQYKKAFIVNREYSLIQESFKLPKRKVYGTNNNLPESIKSEIEKLGIVGVIGLKTDKIPDEVELIITYADEWRWDLKYYINKLSITITDKQSGLVIGKSEFVVSKHEFHNYPDINEVLPVIFSKLFNNNITE